MRTIEMNGSTWRSKDDFYDALAEALGSVEGHGRSAGAFEESMVFDLDMNTVHPPYEVVIQGANDGLRPFLQDFASWIEEARASRMEDPEWGNDVDVKVMVR